MCVCVCVCVCVCIYIYILYMPTKGMSHIKTKIHCYWIIHLRECWVEGSSIWFYLNKTSAESTPIRSKVVKLHWRWTISWCCLFSLALVNDELPFEMCHEFEVFLLLMCAHNFQFLSKQWLELLLKTVTKQTVHILLYHCSLYVCFTSTFPYKWMFIKKKTQLCKWYFHFQFHSHKLQINFTIKRTYAAGQLLFLQGCW